MTVMHDICTACDAPAIWANSDLGAFLCIEHQQQWEDWVADGNLRTPISNFRFDTKVSA